MCLGNLVNKMENKLVNKIDQIIDKYAKHGFVNLRLKEIIESKFHSKITHKFTIQ